MAAKSGRKGQLKIAVATAVDGTPPGTQNILGHLRNWTIDQSANIQTVETASMGNFDSWNESYLLSKSWSGSFSGLWDADNTAFIDTLTIGRNASITLYPDSSVLGESFTGSGVINSIATTAGYDGMIEISFSISGNGALTVTD